LPKKVNSNKSVIGVGALGGSGTRAVAAILQEAGLFIGNDLNHALDNRLFSRLFRNPDWYKSAIPEEITERFALFAKENKGQTLTAPEAKKLRAAISDNRTYASPPHQIKKYRMRWWPSFSKEISTSWGWKEPNTQFYAEYLLKHQPQFKYIHVLRHGLDMAFSNNKSQLKYWGFKYKLPAQLPFDTPKVAHWQLEFWIRSTQAMLKLKAAFPERVYILNRADLITRPKEVIAALLAFAELKAEASKRERLEQIPQPQASDGRYKREDLSIFTSEQIDFVRDFFEN
jgi:hypothetical protein